MTRRKLIAGNWKMNGRKEDSFELVEMLLKQLGGVPCKADLLICPPATLLDRIGEKITGSPLWLGAQDCHSEPSGAFTGDIAAPMIKELGASHVILGHSERRAYHAETSRIVAKKAEAALAAGLIAIICLGETAEQRKRGEAHEVVGRQLRESLPHNAQSGNVVIAYEPIWAIGSGVTPQLDEVQEMHERLRRDLAERLGDEAAGLRILYGGSMTPENAPGLLALPDVDGGLIGGASLKAESFWAIAQAV